MPSSVPIIRAAALSPMLRWLHTHGHDSEVRLNRAALDDYPTDDVLVPIPFRGAVMFLTDIVHSEGADIPFRIVEDGGLHELGLLSWLSVTAQTPRQLLEHINSAMRFHSSHEFLDLEDRDDVFLVRHGIQLSLPDAASNHAVQQYVLAILTKIFSLSGIEPPYFESVRMSPHTEHGYAHLLPWIGADTAVVPGQSLEVNVSTHIADSLLMKVSSEADGPVSGQEHRSLRTDGSVSDSIAFLVESMMQKTKPTIDRVARSIGMSRRTLQRTISREDRDFSTILDDARKTCASKLLSTGEPTMGEVSRRLGYAHQATLTRARRRWNQRSPRQIAQKD